MFQIFVVTSNFCWRAFGEKTIIGAPIPLISSFLFFLEDRPKRDLHTPLFRPCEAVRATHLLTVKSSTSTSWLF